MDNNDVAEIYLYTVTAYNNRSGGYGSFCGVIQSSPKYIYDELETESKKKLPVHIGWTGHNITVEPITTNEIAGIITSNQELCSKIIIEVQNILNNQLLGQKTGENNND